MPLEDRHLLPALPHRPWLTALAIDPDRAVELGVGEKRAIDARFRQSRLTEIGSGEIRA